MLTNCMSKTVQVASIFTKESFFCGESIRNMTLFVLQDLASCYDCDCSVTTIRAGKQFFERNEHLIRRITGFFILNENTNFSEAYRHFSYHSNPYWFGQRDDLTGVILIAQTIQDCAFGFEEDIKRSTSHEDRSASQELLDNIKRVITIIKTDIVRPRAGTFLLSS